MNKNVPLLIGSVVISLGIGSALGYLYAKNELQVGFDSRLEDEIEELRRYYKKRYKTGEYETAEKAAESLSPLGTFKGPRSGIDIPEGPPFEAPDVDPEKLKEVVERLKYDSPHDSPVIEEPWVAIADAQPENPDDESVRIITAHEFIGNDFEHHQPTWQYYQVDDVLVDEGGEIVHDRDEIIGKGTLKCFGQGSDDVDLVYVRNTTLERDYEIARVHEKFGEDSGPGKPRHGTRSKV